MREGGEPEEEEEDGDNKTVRQRDKHTLLVERRGPNGCDAVCQLTDYLLNRLRENKWREG